MRSPTLREDFLLALIWKVGVSPKSTLAYIFTASRWFYPMCLKLYKVHKYLQTMTFHNWKPSNWMLLYLHTWKKVGIFWDPKRQLESCKLWDFVHCYVEFFEVKNNKKEKSNAKRIDWPGCLGKFSCLSNQTSLVCGFL